MTIDSFTNIGLLMLATGRRLPGPVVQPGNWTQMRQAGSNPQHFDDCCSAEAPVTPVQLQANAGLKRRKFRSSRAATAAPSGPAAGDLGAASKHKALGIKRKRQLGPDAGSGTGSDAAGSCGGSANRACNRGGEIPASTAPAPGMGRQLGCVGGQLQRLMKQQRVRMLQNVGQLQRVRALQWRLREAEQGQAMAIREAEEAREEAAEAECGRLKAVQEADQAIQEANEANQEADEARQAAAEAERGRSKGIQEADRARRVAATATATVKSLEALRSADGVSAKSLEGQLSDLELEHAAVRAKMEHLQFMKASLTTIVQCLRQQTSYLELDNKAAQVQVKATRSKAAVEIKTLNVKVSELESELRKAPQQVAHLTARISELELQAARQSWHGGDPWPGREALAREGSRLRVEVDELAREVGRRRAEADESARKEWLNSQALRDALSALKLRDTRVLNLELDNQAAQAVVKAARSEAAAQVKALNKTISELETEMRKAPRVAHFTARISDLERQLQHSAGEAAREEKQRRAEVAEAASEAKRHQAEAARLQNKVSELELQLKCQQKEQSESVSLVSMKGELMLHLRAASTKGELEGIARKLLNLWHPDKHSYLGQGSAALATRVTQIITGLKDECMSRL